VNPAAAASQIPQPGGLPLGSGDRVPRVGQQRSAPLSSPTIERVPRSRITAREIEERRKLEREPGWSERPGVETWQELRDHLATSWLVPGGTVGSSTVVRFMISSVGEVRGLPMITATNVVPKEMSARYREAALAVLQRCLPVRPTTEFGAILHNTVLHLRLVNDAPFPSRTGSLDDPLCPPEEGWLMAPSAAGAHFSRPRRPGAPRNPAVPAHFPRPPRRRGRRMLPADGLWLRQWSESVVSSRDRGEYQQVEFAYRTLIEPNIDSRR
jgi:hypothetical protein